jgi:mannitol PTS system EIICBA or EIICB component
VAEVADEGKSILFMIETNPGPGLGLLLAYWFFGPRALRPTAPGAIIIHFFGGIHEIYFPYVLMRPILIVGMIAGGMAGVFTFLVTGAGLVATPSPGSIFAYLAVTPKGGYFGVLAGVAVAAAVSFVVNALLLKATVHEEDEVVADVAAAETAAATA